TADEAERIRAGRSRHGHEIHADFNPFEVGLAREVHLSKGCYTGQEALQRLITYGSVRRGLVSVSGRGALPSAPADLRRGTERAGRLTSAAREDEDRWIGLAVVRLEDLEPAEPLAIDGSGTLETIEPFPSGAPLGRD